MRDYLTRMKACSTLLAIVGWKFMEKKQILGILGGLGNDYAPIMATITSRKVPYSLKDVAILLQSFEN